MSVFRRLNWRRSASLQRRAWCMGSFLCRDVDELVYADVRHRLQRAGRGVQTTVKLSAKVRRIRYCTDRVSYTSTVNRVETIRLPRKTGA